MDYKSIYESKKRKQLVQRPIQWFESVQDQFLAESLGKTDPLLLFRLHCVGCCFSVNTTADLYWRLI